MTHSLSSSSSADNCTVCLSNRDWSLLLEELSSSGIFLIFWGSSVHLQLSLTTSSGLRFLISVSIAVLESKVNQHQGKIEREDEGQTEALGTRFYKHAEPSALLQLYHSLVRPHLEYASDVWDPHLQRDIQLIENVQKFGLRICSKQWDLGYDELLSNFSVPNLQSRRLHHKLCTMFKIVHI